MMKKLCVNLGTALFAGVVVSGTAMAQPLEEIMQEALNGSQSLAADRASLDAQREAMPQARSAALPSVSLNSFVSTSDSTYDAGRDGNAYLSDLGFADFDATGLSPATTGTGVTLSARQTIFAGGRVGNSIRAAEAGVRAAEASFSAGIEDTVFDIISAYYDVIRIEAQSDALSQSLVTLTEQEQAITKSFDLGRATKTDVAAVSAQRADTEARHITARAKAASARYNFEALTGMTLQSFVLSPQVAAYPLDVDQLVAMARASNANLQAADAIVEVSDAEVSIAKGQRWPAVELVGNLAHAEGNLIEGDSLDSASIQLQASVPLFSGGFIQSDIRKAKAELRSDKFTQADLNRRLEAAIRSAYGEAAAAQASRRSAELQLESRTLTFEGVTIEANLGQRTTLEILDAEDDLLSARFSYIDAQISERLKAYNLLRLTGTLSESFGLPISSMADN